MKVAEKAACKGMGADLVEVAGLTPQRTPSTPDSVPTLLARSEKPGTWVVVWRSADYIVRTSCANFATQRAKGGKRDFERLRSPGLCFSRLTRKVVMAPVQLKLRKALGVVKDQTSIQLAKVVGSPDLDVALVKATSHDEVPTDEKYMHELLHYVSYSRGYTSACISGLAKRISKTHNWIVALKCLMVIHRLLRDGDPMFEQELNQTGSRYGVRILNMSNFRDDSASNAWDYSAFVRTYSLFLDERLECLASMGMSRQDRRSSPESRVGRRSPESNDSYRRSPRDERSRRGGSFGGEYDEERREESRREERSSRNGSGSNKGGPVPMKEMSTDMLLDKLPRLQRLLERVLGCRPTGSARVNRLIQIALYSVVTESFQLYVDLSEGLSRLVDGFFEMDHATAVKAFDVYKRAAKQYFDLNSFYALCKDIGVGRSSEYPSVSKISADQLDELEDHLRDGRTALVVRKEKSPEPKPRSRSPSPERTYEDSLAMKALPAPPVVEEPVQEEEPKPEIKEEPPQTTADLLNLNEDALTPEQQEDRLALALFNPSSGGNGSWEAFGPGDQGGRTTTRDPFAEVAGKENWELALVESASSLSQQKQENLAGGFNPLLLDSMYEQASANRKLATIPTGSESSVALPLGGARPNSNVLALPAPVAVAQAGDDPFGPSQVVPPPAYVQMSDMLKKQQLLAQEQQMWQQYQQEGMQGYYSMMRVYQGAPAYQPQNSFSLPTYQYGMPQAPFLHN
ncbi:hypothetical protein R1sor_006577 [Riccia sorocarpa]|uniref:ENTH domain-containing protein n=1 Tax=Riccia sorocarpa TaxID=122646 RepID=A0ABD3HPQ3_9MARC